MKNLLKSLLKFWASFIFVFAFTSFLCYISNELNIFWEVVGFQFEIYIGMSIISCLLVFINKNELL